MSAFETLREIEELDKFIRGFAVRRSSEEKFRLVVKDAYAFVYSDDMDVCDLKEVLDLLIDMGFSRAIRACDPEADESPLICMTKEEEEEEDEEEEG